MIARKENEDGFFTIDTDLVERLIRGVAEDGSEDLRGEGMEETWAFVLLSFCVKECIFDDNLHTFEDAIGRDFQIEIGQFLGFKDGSVLPVDWPGLVGLNEWLEWTKGRLTKRRRIKF